MTHRALFFLRHYNDIDHIVPVIYKWLELEKGPVDIVVITNPAYLDDYRIQFLRPFDNLRVHFIGDFLSAGQQRKIEAADRIARLYRFHPLRISVRLKSRIVSSIPQDPYDVNVIKKMLDYVFGDEIRGTVAFDWLSIRAPHLRFARQVVQSARERGLNAVALPHGDSPHYNRMIRLNELDYSVMDHYASVAIFNYIAVPNELCARRYRPHMDGSRIKVLGSPRYNDEWLDILLKLTPNYDDVSSKGTFKIAFFLRNPLYPVFWEEVIRTIKLVTQFEEVSLIVKHHTRDGGLQRLINTYPELNSDRMPNLRFVYEEVHSGALLKWADAVMDIGTSIAFEAVKIGKPVLAVEYLHPSVSTVAHYMKACSMQCRDDLYDAMAALIGEVSGPFYDETERARFMREIIEVPDANVLERYVKFLEHSAFDRSNEHDSE